jgi:hypothetical protein
VLVDLDLLFGNMDQVMALSQRLLTAMEESTQGKDFEEQKIGDLIVLFFFKIISNISNVYIVINFLFC